METQIRTKKRAYAFFKFFITSILIFTLLCEIWYLFFKVFFLILIEKEKVNQDSNLIALAFSFSIGTVLLIYFRRVLRLVRVFSGIEDYNS